MENAKNILDEIKWEEDVNVEPVVSASKHKNDIRIILDEDNYIQSKIYLSRAQRKEYDKIGLEHFELDVKTKDVNLKEGVDLDALISSDKIAKLEGMLYKKMVFEGKEVKITEEALRKDDKLMSLRNKLVEILVKLNELGL